MSALMELAARVEAATGPDRRIDVEIAALIGIDNGSPDWTVADSIRISGINRVVEQADTAQNIWSSRVPRYTASIDAAMSPPDERELPEIINEAYERTCIDGYQIGDFRGQFARNIIACWLRAQALITGGE